MIRFISNQKQAAIAAHKPKNQPQSIDPPKFREAAVPSMHIIHERPPVKHKPHAFKRMYPNPYPYSNGIYYNINFLLLHPEKILSSRRELMRRFIPIEIVGVLGHVEGSDHVPAQ
jgi:hypothetical protein